MMRNWIAVALLSTSWMWGLEYYTAANGWLWAVAVLAAVALLSQSPRRAPCRADLILALCLVLPALWLIGWPYRAIPLGLALGLLPLAIEGTPRWLVALGWGTLRSAVLLAAQAVVLRGYALFTARSHDLPWPGSALVAAVARLLGVEASADGPYVALFSTSGPQRIAATWELALDPVTVLLLTGAIVLVTLWNWEDRPWGAGQTFREKTRYQVASIGWVLLAVGLWVPVRLALFLGLFLAREMRAPEDLKLTVMNQFFSPWVLGAASLGAVAGLAFWVRRRPPALQPAGEQPTASAGFRGRALAASVTVVFVGIAALLFVFDPVGTPREGRVVFVERHSDWEPTDRPYDTESFGHDPSYSYSAIYRYCRQYFDVSRIQDDEPIDTARLADCDVLVIKTPTEPYSSEEIRAVEGFVAAGGGLLLIGEHTDYMRSSSCLNRIVKSMGFKFRPDNLYAVHDPYVQHVTPRRVPHPAVRNVPFMRYAGSCSIDPGWSWGRPAVWNTGLWSLGADYNMQNFFPEAYYRPEMRYGAFIQLWETRHGKGRVLAFTDSTIFSNFSTFEPGKAELMLDMLSWLNRRSVFDASALRLLLRASGLLFLAALIWLGVRGFPRTGSFWLVVVAAVLLGYLASTGAVAAWQRGHLPECRRPLVRIVVDRTVSDVPLSEGGFTHDPQGYGLLEQWIPRLGHYTVRADGREAFTGDVLLAICPTKSVPEQYRKRLVEWVENGGKLVVFDSIDSIGTTANSLLWPFGLAVYHADPAEGVLRLEDSDWPDIQVPSACHVEGGDPFMWVGDTPVAARTEYGEGTVTAVGFASLMNNANMGGAWTVEPGPAERVIYDVLFELIDAVVEARPVRPPASEESESRKEVDSLSAETFPNQEESP